MITSHLRSQHLHSQWSPQLHQEDVHLTKEICQLRNPYQQVSQNFSYFFSHLLCPRFFTITINWPFEKRSLIYQLNFVDLFAKSLCVPFEPKIDLWENYWVISFDKKFSKNDFGCLSKEIQHKYFWFYNRLLSQLRFIDLLMWHAKVITFNWFSYNLFGSNLLAEKCRDEIESFRKKRPLFRDFFCGSAKNVISRDVLYQYLN